MDADERMFEFVLFAFAFLLRTASFFEFRMLNGEQNKRTTREVRCN